MADWSEVLKFWFEEADSSQWFTADDTFDALVRDRLGSLHEQASAGVLDAWKSTPEGALALILLFDQVPRNIFRGEARAYETDSYAVACAHYVIENDFDLKVEMPKRLFFYLPLQHSETLEDQYLCLTLLKERVADPDAIDYARRHADVIEQFRRFPARNAALGRDSTDEELAFLAENPQGF